MSETLIVRLNEPWERMDGAAARKINRILKERKEAAERIATLEACLRCDDESVRTAWAREADWKAQVEAMRMALETARAAFQVLINSIVQQAAPDYEWHVVSGDPEMTVCNAADALSALSAPVEESGVYLEWRPIETVPRDGTSVLICFAKKTGRLDGVYQVFWANIHGGETTPENGSWCVDDEKHGPYALRGWCVGDPTAWLPLPTPPKSEADHG